MATWFARGPLGVLVSAVLAAEDDPATGRWRCWLEDGSALELASSRGSVHELVQSAGLLRCGDMQLAPAAWVRPDAVQSATQVVGGGCVLDLLAGGGLLQVPLAVSAAAVHRAVPASRPASVLAQDRTQDRAQESRIRGRSAQAAPEIQVSPIAVPVASERSSERRLGVEVSPMAQLNSATTPAGLLSFQPTGGQQPSATRPHPEHPMDERLD